MTIKATMGFKMAATAKMKMTTTNMKMTTTNDNNKDDNGENYDVNDGERKVKGKKLEI